MIATKLKPYILLAALLLPGFAASALDVRFGHAPAPPATDAPAAAASGATVPFSFNFAPSLGQAPAIRADAANSFLADLLPSHLFTVADKPNTSTTAINRLAATAAPAAGGAAGQNSGAPLKLSPNGKFVYGAASPNSVKATPKNRLRVLQNGPVIPLTDQIVNGGFETGDFTGWTTVDPCTQGNPGTWSVYTGTTSPISGSPIPAPPEKTHAAISDQSGPGTHILYQDVMLQPNTRYTLSFQIYYVNQAGAFTVPNSLDCNAGTPNQQYRVDLINPNAAVDSVSAADVLQNVYQTNVGDPASLNPTQVNVSINSASVPANGIVRLRFAEVDNQNFFQAGVDNVQLNQTTVGTGALTKVVSRPTAAAGDLLTYTLTATNPTAGTLANVQVKDTLPSGAAFVVGSPTGPIDTATGQVRTQSITYGSAGNSNYQLSPQGLTPSDPRYPNLQIDSNVTSVQFNIPTLAPGATNRMEFQVRVTPAGPAAIVNNASLTVSNALAGTSSATTAITVGPSVTKRSDKQVILSGDSFFYNIVLFNPQPNAVTITAQDTLPASLTEIPNTVTVDPGTGTSSAAADSIVTNALAAGTYTQTVAANSYYKIRFEVLSNANVTPGSDIHNTISLTNIHEVVNGAVTYPPQSDTSDTQVGILNFTKTVDKSSALSTTTPTANGNQTQPPMPGELLNYTISISNPTDTNLFTGPGSPPSPAALQVNDALPIGGGPNPQPLEDYVVGSAQGTSEILFSNSNPAFTNYFPQTKLNPFNTDSRVEQIRFGLASMAAHSGPVTLQFQTRVAPDLTAGTAISNTATINGSVGEAGVPPNPGPNNPTPFPYVNSYGQTTGPAVTTVQTIQFDKVVDKASAVAGDQLTYTISVNDTSANFTLIDTADPNVLFDKNTDSISFDGAARETGAAALADYNTLTTAGHAFAGGGTHTIIYTVHIASNTAVGTVIQNSALDSTGGGIQSTIASTTVGELHLTKTVDKTAVPAGGTLNYTIQVDNQTDSTINIAKITDIVPTGATLVPGSAVVGEASGFTLVPGTGNPVGPDTLVWNLNSFPPHASPIFLHFSVQVNTKDAGGNPVAAGSTITNLATASYSTPTFYTGPNGQPASGASVSNQTVSRVELLEFHKLVDKSLILPGDVLHYTLTYTNLDPNLSDPSPSAKTAIRDTLSPGQTYVYGSLFIDGVQLATNPPQNPDPKVTPFFSASGLTLPTANIPMPGGRTHTITYTVKSDGTSLVGAKFTNQAFLITDPADTATAPLPSYGAAGSVPSESTSVTVGSLTIVKNAFQSVPDPNTGTTTDQFTITVSNPTDTLLPVSTNLHGGALITDAIDPNLKNVTVTNGPNEVVGNLGPAPDPSQPPSFVAAANGTGAIQFRVPLTAHSIPTVINFSGTATAINQVCNTAWGNPAYASTDDKSETIGNATVGNTVCLDTHTQAIQVRKVHTNPTSNTFIILPGSRIDYGTVGGGAALGVPGISVQFSANLVQGLVQSGGTSYRFTTSDPIPPGASYVVGSGQFTSDNGNPGNAEFQNVPTEFSNNHGFTWTYVPSVGPDGVTDPNVTDIRWEATVANLPATVTQPTGGVGSLSVIVNPNDADGTVIRNVGQVSTPDFPATVGPGLFLVSNPDNMVVTRGALNKSVNLTQAQENDNLIYGIDYNFGSSPTPPPGAFYIVDAIPAGTHYIVNSASSVLNATGKVVALPEFSNDNGQTYTATPISDLNGLDTKITDVRWNIVSSVIPGHVGFAVHIDGATVDNQAIPNTAFGLSASLGSTLFNPYLTSNTVLTTIDALKLTKTVDRTAALSGDVLHYGLTYKNGLAKPIAGAFILDPIPANTTYVVGSAFGLNVQFLDATGAFITPKGGNPGNTDPNVATVVFNLGTLVPGASGAVGFAVRINDNTAINTLITNQGTIDSTTMGIEPRLSNPVITAVYPLSLTKSVDQSIAPPGANLTYTVQYAEEAGFDASNVVITDAIPANTGFVVGSASGSATGVIVAYSKDGGQTYTYVPVGASGTVDPNVTNIQWTIGSVPASNTGSVTFQVQIQNTAAIGLTISNQAFQTSTLPNNIKTPPGGYGSNVVQTQVGLVQLVKSVDLPFALPGEQLNYTINLKDLTSLANPNGPALTNVTVVDQIPANTLYVMGSAAPVIYNNGVIVTPEFSADNGMTFSTTPPGMVLQGINLTPNLIIRWTFPTIPTNAPPLQLTFGVRIDDATIPAGGAVPPDGTSIVNTAMGAVAGGQEFFSNPAITQISSTVIRKAVDRSSALPGDILTFNVNFENRSTSPLVGAIVQDNIPAHTAFVVGSAESPADIVAGSPVADENLVQYFDGNTWNYIPVVGPDGITDPVVQAIRILVDVQVPAGTPPVQDDMKKGETGSLTFQVGIDSGDPKANPPVRPAPPFGTIITNTAFLMSTVNNVLQSIPSNTTQTSIYPLRLVKTVDRTNTVLPPIGPPGSDILTYSITALDIAEPTDPAAPVVPLTNVQITDFIPGNTQFIVGSVAPIANGIIEYSTDGGVTFGPYTGMVAPGSPDPAVNAIRWTFATIAPDQNSGNVATFKVKIVATANIAIPNFATGIATFQPAGSPLPPTIMVGPVKSNTVITTVSLTSFNKLDNHSLYVRPGDVLSYTLPFQNFASTPLTNVVVTDVLPPGLQLVSAQISGNPAGTSTTLDTANNTVTFKLGTVAANTVNPPNGTSSSPLYQLQITTLVSVDSTPGAELDNTASATYDGLLKSIQTNTTRNIVASSSVNGVDALDASAFHQTADHIGTIPVNGLTALCLQWEDILANQQPTSFVASPVVVRGVPTSNVATVGSGAVGVLSSVLEYIGDTSGNFYAIQAGVPGSPPTSLWTVQLFNNLPVETTATVAQAPYGAIPTYNKTNDAVTGITYLRQSQYMVVVGTGGIDPNTGPTAGAVECLNATTGEELWRFDLPAPVIGSPIIVNNVSAHLLFRNPNTAINSKALPFNATVDVVYVGCADGNVYALSLSGAQPPNFPGKIEAQVLWVQPAAGSNLGSPAALGLAAVAYTEQVQTGPNTGLFTDYINAVSSDATVDNTGFPIDAAGNQADPFAIDTQGNSTPDYPVPTEFWKNGRVQISPAGTPSAAPLTQSPAVDNSVPTTPIIHIADQKRLIALDGNTGLFLDTFTNAGAVPPAPLVPAQSQTAIQGISSTPAVVKLPNLSTAGAPATTMVYFSSVDSTGGNAAPFHNQVYALSFGRTGTAPNFSYKYTWVWGDNADTVPGFTTKATLGAVPGTTSSVVAAVDPNTGGSVYLATETGAVTGPMAGQVVSYDATTGVFNGPMCPSIATGSPPAPFEFGGFLTGDPNQNAQATLAVSLVSGADRPWVFGSTLGGSLFALGRIPVSVFGAGRNGSGGYGGGIGVGPPGVQLTKSMTNTTAQNDSVPRANGLLQNGDRLHIDINALSTGYGIAVTGGGGTGGGGGGSLPSCACDIPATGGTGGGTGGSTGSTLKAPLKGLVIVENIPDNTDYQSGSATAIYRYDPSEYPNSPVRWVIPQPVMINNRVVQVVWDFRNTVDQYGNSGNGPNGPTGPNSPNGAVSVPGLQNIHTALDVTVHTAVVQSTGGPKGVQISTTTNGPDISNTPVEYGQSLYIKASGFTIKILPVSGIQNVAAVYADNANQPLNPAYATYPDPIPVQMANGAPIPPGNATGGVFQPPDSPPLPLLNPTPTSVAINTVAPYPTTPLTPFKPGGPIPAAPPETGTPPTLPAPSPASTPEMYATPVSNVDLNPNDVKVYLKLMRYNPAQPAFIPDLTNPDGNVMKRRLVWEPAEQRRSPFFLKDALLVSDGNGGYTATPNGPIYTIDTRNPNQFNGALSAGASDNGALSPSPVLYDANGNGECYTVEVWDRAGDSSGASGGFLTRSGFFGVNNPLNVAAGKNALDVNGIATIGEAQSYPPLNLLMSPNGNMPQAGPKGTLLDVGSTGHNHSSAPVPYVVWDSSKLVILKPATGIKQFMPFAKFSNLQVRIVKPDHVKPQASARHLSAVAPFNPLNQNGFNPHPAEYPSPWDPSTRSRLDFHEDPNTTSANNGPNLIRTFDFMDGYPDMGKNGISSNQYHWDPNTHSYLYDANTNDSVLANGHYETWAALKGQLGIATDVQAKTLFNQDYPGIPTNNETWQLGAGANPVFSLSAIPNNALPTQGQFAVAVPHYQPDDELSPSGHNPTDANTTANHWYGYLGRAYVVADIISDANLHVFDPVVAAPESYGNLLLVQGSSPPRYVPAPPMKDATYEDPYRVLDVASEVPADINFKFAQTAINLGQYPHGYSDMAQLILNGGADALKPNTAWAPFDIQNWGNVNLVALGPWHFDNVASKWRVQGSAFNATRPFFSDNLYGKSVGALPIDPHIYISRADLFWSATPRAQQPYTGQGTEPFANVGKLPKAQAGAAFETSLSGVQGNNVNGVAGNNTLFAPWLGIDIPVGQPVGAYSNTNVHLWEPSPNYVVTNSGTTPPDPISDPNVQGASNLDNVGVEHPIASTDPLTLTVSVAEAAPPVVPQLPSEFNKNGYTQAGTINDQLGNDDSTAAVVQSYDSNNKPSTITSGLSQLYLYFASNRNGNGPNALSGLWTSSLSIPYDISNGAAASSYGMANSSPGLGAYPGALWNSSGGNGTPTELVGPNLAAPNNVAVNDVSVLWTPSVGGIASFNSPAGSVFTEGLQFNGQPQGNVNPLFSAQTYTRHPRVVNVTLDPASANVQLTGVVAYGNLGSRTSIVYIPANQGVGPQPPVYNLPTPASLLNPKDPSVLKITGGPDEGATLPNDYEAVGYAASSPVDHQTSIYINRFGPTIQYSNNQYFGVPGAYDVQTVNLGGATGGTFKLSYLGYVTSPIPSGAAASVVQAALTAIPGATGVSFTVTGANGGPYIITFIGGNPGEVQQPISMDVSALTGGNNAGVIHVPPHMNWARVGLSVALRTANSADARAGETLLPDVSGVLYTSRHLQWAMPMPRTVPAAGYPQGTDYTDWPQLMLFNTATNNLANVQGVNPLLTPPLNPQNIWLYDTANRVWLLQDRTTRKLILAVDASSGAVRFASPLPNSGTLALRADYTPGSLRLTRAPSNTSGASAISDSTPVVLVDDSLDALAHPVTEPGGATNTVGGTTWAGPVSRHTLWVVWRRSQTASQGPSTLFYTAYRLQVDLPVQLKNSPLSGAPDIQVYYTGANGNLVANTLWGIDLTHNRIWFDGSLEGQDVKVVMNKDSGAAFQFNATIGWEPAISETPLQMRQVVNEGQPNAYLENVTVPLFDPVLPLPLDVNGNPTMARASALDNPPTQLLYTYPKLWIFWSSTRTGSGPASGNTPNTDIYYEVIVPQL